MFAWEIIPTLGGDLQWQFSSFPYLQYVPTHVCVGWWIGAARFRIMLGPLTQNHFILQFTNKYHTIPSLIFCAPSLPIIFSEASPWSVSIRYIPGFIIPGENRKTANTSSLSVNIFDTDYSVHIGMFYILWKHWHWFKTLLAKISNFNKYKIIRGWHCLSTFWMDTWPNPSNFKYCVILFVDLRDKHMTHVNNNFHMTTNKHLFISILILWPCRHYRQPQDLTTIWGNVLRTTAPSSSV